MGITNDHLNAIRRGHVTKTNVTGIRKALNADYRRQRGYSVSRSAPKLQGAELASLMQELRNMRPTVTGDLDQSGFTLLRSQRWHKRWNDTQHSIIDNLESFRLWDFMQAEDGLFHPIFQAVASNGAFTFYNIPWQSGGTGPEIWGGA